MKEKDSPRTAAHIQTKHCIRYIINTQPICVNTVRRGKSTHKET